MKITVNFAANHQGRVYTLLPLEHRPDLVHAIHACFLEAGENYIGQEKIEFSFTNVLGGRRPPRQRRYIQYQRSMFFNFSSPDAKIIRDLIRGIQKKEIFTLYGHEFPVASVRILPEPDFQSGTGIFILKDLFLRELNQGCDYRQPVSAERIIEVLRAQTLRRLAAVNLPSEGLSLEIMGDHYARVRSYKDLYHRVFSCQLSVRADPKTLFYLYHAGIGQSTGIGYGHALFQR